MKKINRLLLTFCFGVSLTACYNTQPKENQKPNIVWIVCEDISPFLGAYGDKIVNTPNIDQLAREGILYTRAFTTAGVCATSRSAIITGMYQTSIGTHNMRTLNGPSALKYSNGLNYSAVIPSNVKCFPEYLRMNGYYCTNNTKQDYQFNTPVTVWDENDITASWVNRAEGQPFFSVFNFAITHESQLMGRTDSLLVNPDETIIPPYLPDTKIAHRDMARLLTNIERMDTQVGELLTLLKETGVYDETIVFFYSDHGGALPWMKREVLDRGIHIPLIIRFPNGQNANTINDDLVSSVDFAPTVLSLADITIPSHMQGQAFLGKQKAAPRSYIFGARDRMDSEYDRVRAVRDKRYEYIFNYMPEKPYYQDIEYRLGIPLMKEILEMRDSNKLNPEQQAWFKTKPVEELYDLETDPHQLINLAFDPEYAQKLEELRSAFKNWTDTFGDLGSVPEKELISKWWDGKDKAPQTETPKIIETEEGFKIECTTVGASIGYQVCSLKGSNPRKHKIMSWDFAVLMNPNLKNGAEQNAHEAWLIYSDMPIQLEVGDTLKVNAMRIGYEPATATFVKTK